MGLLWRVQAVVSGHVAVRSNGAASRAADAVRDAIARADAEWRDHIAHRLGMEALDVETGDFAHPGLEPGTWEVDVRLYLEAEVRAADEERAKEEVDRCLSAKLGLTLPLARHDPAISDLVVDSWAVGWAEET